MFDFSIWVREECNKGPQAICNLVLARRVWLAVLAAALTFAWPTHGWAGFMWLGDWNANPTSATVGPGTTALPTFGDVTADVANAGGSAAATSDPTVNSSASVIVTFVRNFILFDNPHDSFVTLFGTLSGALNTTSADAVVGASVSYTVIAQIVDILGFIEPNIRVFDIITAVNENENEFLLLPLSESANLADGIYSIRGSLDVEAIADQGPVGIADANANLNLIVGLLVQPIPEPPTIVLQVTAAAVLLALLRRQRVRRARIPSGSPRFQDISSPAEPKR